MELGTLTADMNAIGAKRHFSLGGFLWRSIILGVVCALMSGPVALYLGTLASLADIGISPAPTWTPWVSPDPAADNVVFVLVLILLVAPIVESLIFPPLYWLARRLPMRRTLFVIAIGVIAFFAHGGAAMNGAQAIGFMLMAAWYAHLADIHPSPRLLSATKIPFYGVLLTHFAWNLTAVVWAVGVPSFWSTLHALTP